MKFKKLLFFFILFPFFLSCDEIYNAVNNENRDIANKQRDKYRNPFETLNFFGIKENMNVLEVLPGRGWYTEILSFLLKQNGNLTVASFGSKHKIDFLRNMHNDFEKKFKNTELYGKIKFEIFLDKSFFPNIESKSQDMILTFRNNHNWIKTGNIKKIYSELHKILKNNGILGVVQHRSNDKTFNKPKLYNGYVSEKYLIKLIEECGFKLVGKSDINSNSLDKKNYKDGVWSLPPTLRSGKKKKYLEIGESDRMTLKFIKN